MKLNHSIEKLYNKILKIKKKESQTSYPFSILDDDQVIFTKKQIDLFYINNYKTLCNEYSDKNSKDGGYENKVIVFLY